MSATTNPSVIALLAGASADDSPETSEDPTLTRPASVFRGRAERFLLPQQFSQEPYLLPSGQERGVLFDFN